MKKSFTYCLLVVFLMHFLIGTAGLKAEDSVGLSYREKIELQIGRRMYVAGETIWYKAYAFSNLKEIYSKVLYLELVDHDSRHVLGQIVEITDRVAASSFIIPDTLTSGTYRLLAYTNWMRNFSSEHFNSYTIYIYNQYDEDQNEDQMQYSQLLKPSIFLENGMLIEDALTRIKISFEGWIGDTVTGSLIGSISGTKVADCSIDRSGEGTCAFLPKAGEHYRIEIVPREGHLINFELPSVELAKPAINIIGSNHSELLFQIVNAPVRSTGYELVVFQGEQKIQEKNIPGSTTDTLAIELNHELQGMLRMVLLDMAGHELADKNIFVNPNTGSDRNETLEYKTREKVRIPLSSLLKENTNWSQVSISVYKPVHPEINRNNEVSMTSFSGHFTSVDLGGTTKLLIPLNTKELDNEIGIQQEANGGIEFPVEDIGVLYSGRVVNSVNDGPLANVEVILAVKDTIPQLLFSNTDNEGRFFYLVDGYGEKYAMINLYLKGAQLSGSFKIMLDDKFYYRQKHQLISEISLPKDGQMEEYMNDEAQRVLIQRAFGREVSMEDAGSPSGSKEPFYQGNINVVYPAEYFDLPNFEEIAREILPRVRYKHSKSGCDVIIIHLENGMKTSSPIVLLDGLPVKDYCELYPLRSEDINRVEILSGGHISGNLYYEGLLAVYTSSTYRAKNTDRNGRSFYDISGYYISPEFSGTDYNEEKDQNIHLADFKNQLFWEPEFDVDSAGDMLEFHTSDEEGRYIINICGFKEDGQLWSFSRTLNVKSE